MRRGELGREWDRKARNAAVAAHVLALVTGPFGPAAVLREAREDEPFVRFHATQAILFGAIALPLVLATCGVGVFVAVPLVVLAAVRAARGEWVGYPLLSGLSR
jgi:uncharacterized membrane protein